MVRFQFEAPKPANYEEIHMLKTMVKKVIWHRLGKVQKKCTGAGNIWECLKIAKLGNVVNNEQVSSIPISRHAHLDVCSLRILSSSGKGQPPYKTLLMTSST